MNSIDQDIVEIRGGFIIALICILVNAIALPFIKFLLIFSFISLILGYTAYDFKKEHGFFPWSKKIEL